MDLGFGGEAKKDDLLYHSDTQEPKNYYDKYSGHVGYGNLFDSGFLQKIKIFYIL